MRASVLLALLALAGAAAAGRDLLGKDDPHGKDTQTFINRPNKYSVDVVVVGGGFAGLTAARNLARKGHKVAVVEAQQSLGGRSQRTYASTRTGQNVTCAPGNKLCPEGVWWYDRGGQWLGMTNSQDRLYAMSQEYGVKTYPIPQESGQYRIIMGGGVQMSDGTWFDEAPTAAEQRSMTGQQAAAWDGYNTAAEALYEIVDQVKNYLRNPWAYPRVDELDAVTFKAFVESQTNNPLSQQLMYWLYCDANGGYNPASISVFEMARILAGYLDGGSEEKLFFGGAGQFIQLMEKEIKFRGGLVYTHSPVRHITQDAYAAAAYTDTHAFLGKYIVVATPPHLSGRITYDPPLPARRAQLTQRFPMGTTVKCIGLFKNAFWRQRNGGAQTGDNVVALAIQPGAVVNEVFDITPPYPDAPGILAGFLFDNVALTLTEQGPQAVEKAVLKRWAEMMNDPRVMTESVNFIYINWPEEQWVGGAYNSFTTPGTWKVWGKSMYDPFGRVHWAGTEYAFKWLGYYDGAIRSGEETAAKISGLLSAKRG